MAELFLDELNKPITWVRIPTPAVQMRLFITEDEHESWSENQRLCYSELGCYQELDFDEERQLEIDYDRDFGENCVIV